MLLTGLAVAWFEIENRNAAPPLEITPKAKSTLSTSGAGFSIEESKSHFS